MPKLDPPSAREFVKALWADWVNRFSGGAGIPMTLLGLWVENNVARVICFLTAAGCLGVAGYRTWAVERQRVLALDPPTRERISLLEFARIAERDYGWNFESGWEVLDLLIALKHAANDGVIQLQGKKFASWGTPPADAWVRAQHVYHDIPRADWTTYDIGIQLPLTTTFNDTDNFDIVVTAVWNDAAPKYYDPHLSDRVSALRWLERTAVATRGFSERSEAEKASRSKKSSDASWRAA